MAEEKITKNEKLTKAQEIFVSELIKGVPQRHALLKAYPDKSSWQWNSIDSAASTLFRKEKVRKRYDQLMDEIRAAEQAEAKWTREQSINVLKDIIKRNIGELNRINSAYEEDIENLLNEIKKKPSRATKLTADLLQKRKTRRITTVHNTGVIAAVAELNKMQGFNEENINLNGTVVFAGEDELEE